MNKLIGILLILSIGLPINAQELKCDIIINSDKVPGSNRQVFETLQASINELVNQKKWTNKTYLDQEKIQCAMTFTILEQPNPNEFKGHLQIQASRPVFNTTYLTPIFNYKDDNLSFRYTEFETLQFNETSFESNLVSMISYYVYTILGIDADTFALNGGEPYYKLAQNIVIQAQQSGYTGWNQNDGNKSRFSLIDDMLSPAFSIYRNTLYSYHINAIDIMYVDKKKAKEVISTSILQLKTISETRPNSQLVRTFFDAKSDEIVNVFSDGPRFDTGKLKDNLMKMSPVNMNKWSSIK